MHLADTFPSLTDRATKERWLYSKPAAFTQHVPAQESTLTYAETGMLEHVLKQGVWHHGTHSITLAAGQKRTLVELVSEDGAETVLTDTLAFDLAENSHLTHIRLHAGTGHKQRRVVQATLKEGAQYQQFTLTLGAALARSETDVICAGSGAQVALVGLALLRGAERVDAGQRVTFAAPGCNADVRQRNVVAGQAHAGFQGKFHVDAAAQQTDAYMLCQNILLNEGAGAAHKPELEIYADDVKCSHGATTGTLDAAQLFYLQARGIPAPLARQMLIAAQVQDLLTALPDAVRVRALALTEHWLKEVSHD